MSNEKKAQKSKANEKSLADAPTSKKIGFFSAMLIVMGSSIGAGIFFKSKAVLDGAHGNLILAIAAWLIAGFAVIAMAMALIEVASARNDNLSLIGWCKTFNSRTIYKASKNFMFYIYLPLTYFFMPLYVILSLQDGIGALTAGNSSIAGPNTFGTSVDWLIWTVISLAISAYFIIVSGRSSRMGNIQNKIIMGVKFIPLAVAGIIGFVYVAIMGTQGITVNGFNPNFANSTSFGGISPGLGMLVAIAGIFFAYDGFYVTAGIQTEMKEPKKTPWAILAGLGATTIIYLIIAISMSLNGDGSFFGFGDWLAQNNVSWVFGVVNLMIAFGVLGIINGFAMWAPRFIEDLMRERELPFSEKYAAKLSNGSKPWVGIIYSGVITAPIVILFTLIGSLAYIDGYNGAYGSGMGNLYTFADLMANWTAVLAFVFIALPIAGAIKNRKTQKVETVKSKFFLPMAYSSVTLVGLTLFLQVLGPILNVFLLFNNPLSQDEIIGRWMLVVVLLIFAIIIFVPTILEDYSKKKKNLPLDWNGSNKIDATISKEALA